MNILILNWKDIKHPNVGGAEIIIYELAKRFVKNGDKVTWFCRNFIYGKSEEEYDGINIIRRGNLLTTYLYAPFYYWGLKEKPDVVIDMSNTIYWQTPLWAFKSRRFAYLNQLAQEVFDYEYPSYIRGIGKLIEKIQYLTYKTTQFIVYSKSTTSDLGLMGIDKKNIKVFPLGIDHSRYSVGKKSKTPLFICVNRLVKMKRNDLAIYAMSIVVKKYPNAKLMIVGYGYDRFRLERLRDELGLQGVVVFQDENVLFFNKVKKDEKIRLMQEAWALIFPSVKEGWGMTVTECAACGTLSIGTKVTGLQDSIIDEKTGLLVSANPSPEELAQSMIRIISDSDLRNKLSKNAANYWKDFTWDNSFKSFNKLIQK
jgi:glycosyltransferase involved in cell wall biosynthesis